MTLDRTIAPESVDVKPFDILRAKTINLTNKIPVHYIRMGSQNLLKFDIVFNAGHVSESNKGQSFFTAKMLSEGTTNHTQKEIADKIAFYGAQLEIVSGLDKTTISLIALEKHIYILFPLISEIISASTFPEKNFENIKNIYIQQLKINLEKTSFVATGTFKQHIFGANHPYGYFISEEETKKLNINDCKSFYNSSIKDNSFEIILSGNVNDDVLKGIDKYFGQIKLKLSDKNDSHHNMRIEPMPTHVNIEKEGAVQSSLRIGKRMFTRQHPDYFKFTVLNEVLGGYFGSRLMKTIREEKGLTYGIYSQIITNLNEGYFVIGADVKKEFLNDAVEEIFAQIALLADEEIDADELNTVKNYMIGTYLSSVNTPFALADKFRIIHFNHLDYSYYDNYISNIRKITAKELQKLAKKYFDKSSFTKVVVG